MTAVGLLLFIIAGSVWNSVVATQDTINLRVTDITFSDYLASNDTYIVSTGEYYVGTERVTYNFYDVSENNNGFHSYLHFDDGEIVEAKGLTTSFIVTGKFLVGIHTIEIHALDGDGFVTTTFIYHINPIKFNLNVDNCLTDSIEISLRSKIHDRPALENIGSLTVLKKNCSFNLSEKVSIIRDSCDEVIENGVRIIMVISYGTFVSEENSQMFEVSCNQDYTSTDVATDTILSVETRVDEIFNIFQTPFLFDMLFRSPSSGAPLAYAEVGDEVVLEVALNPLYTSDFDLKVNNCYLDGTIIYANGNPTTGFFKQFTKESQGVLRSYFNVFMLSRDEDGNVSDDGERVLNFICSVETCIDSCIETSTRLLRRRRFAKRSRYSSGEMFVVNNLRVPNR